MRIMPRIVPVAIVCAALLLPSKGGSDRKVNAAAPLFVEAAASTGLDFTHVNGASGQYFMAEQMGPGVALFDYDNDGDLDVFLLHGRPLRCRPGTPRASADP